MCATVPLAPYPLIFVPRAGSAEGIHDRDAAGDDDQTVEHSRGESTRALMRPPSMEPATIRPAAHRLLCDSAGTAESWLPSMARRGAVTARADRPSWSGSSTMPWGSRLRVGAHPGRSDPG